MNNNRNITSHQITKSLASEEWELVKVNIRYPQYSNERIDKYISDIAGSFLKFAEKKLLPKAVRENSEPYSLVVIYKIVTANEKYFSFYFDMFVSHKGEKGEVKRIPLNFDVENSTLIFPLEKTKKRVVFPLLERAAEKLSYTAPLYSDFDKRAKKYFKKNNALLSTDGIYVTYDSGILMPHDKGAVNLFVTEFNKIYNK